MKSLSDALKRASTDAEFSKKLLSDPQSLAGEYDLSDEQIQTIRNADKSKASQYDPGNTTAAEEYYT